MDDHGIWTNPQEDEIGRFLNIDGERFVLYKDRTFASDETDWERVPIEGASLREEGFLFSGRERAAIEGIVLSAFGRTAVAWMKEKGEL
jgi:hypothetical protein